MAHDYHDHDHDHGGTAHPTHHHDCGNLSGCGDEKGTGIVREDIKDGAVTPKSEYPNRDAARRDLFAYIEGYYNRQRRHSAIGYITPEQAEAKAA